MEDLHYVDEIPNAVRVKVEDLRVGYVHVARMETGKYELGRIHEVSSIANGAVTFRFGEVGHATRTCNAGQYVDVLRESIRQ